MTIHIHNAQGGHDSALCGETLTAGRTLPESQINHVNCEKCIHAQKRSINNLRSHHEKCKP